MSTAINQTMDTKQWMILAILSILWGGSFFFVEIALEGLPPLTLVTLRVGFAALALWIFVKYKGLVIPSSPSVWVAFLGMGLLNNVIPFSLIVWGQTHIGSGLASILNATTPLFTVVIASTLLTDEKATPLKLIGVLVGFTGVIIMIGSGALQGISADVLAQIAVLGAAISYGFAGVFGRRFREMNINPVITAAGQVTASFIVLLPISFMVDQPLSLAMPQPQVWVSVIALAILSTALAYILYFQLLASAGATNLLLVTFLIPVSATLLGVFVLGEALLPMQAFGMGLIGLGLSAIDGRLWKKR